MHPPYSLSCTHPTLFMNITKSVHPLYADDARTHTRTRARTNTHTYTHTHTQQVAAGKKHQTHPKKGSKISVPPGGSKYQGAQTQVPMNMGVGGAGINMQVQGLQGGFGVLAGQQQPNTQQHQQHQPRLAGGIGGGKYGMNINMNITSTKYQGGGAAGGGGGGGGRGGGGRGAVGWPSGEGWRGRR
jgi:hypothetical protein